MSSIKQQAIVRLANIYNEKLNVDQLKAYDTAFASIPDSEFLKAMNGILRTAKRFPSIAEITEIVEEKDLAAEVSWSIALECARSGRVDERLGPAGKMALESIGFKEFQMSNPDQVGVYHAQFLKAYKAFNSGMSRGSIPRVDSVRGLARIGDVCTKLLGGHNEDSERVNCKGDEGGAEKPSA